MKNNKLYQYDLKKNIIKALEEEFKLLAYIELAEDGTADKFWATPIVMDKRTRKGWRLDHKNKIVLRAVRHHYNLEELRTSLKRKLME